jgi:putative ABC transport system permease protein
MIKNYFKTTIRNLVKHKGYSFINISGLAMGIACCLLIILYVKDELTFDRFHKDGENVYRMQSAITMNDNKQVFNAVGLPTGPTLLDEMPEVVNQVRFMNNALEVRIGDNEYNEGNAYYAEPEFLEVFNFPSWKGDGNTTLKQSAEIALTKESAIKYFGKENAIGETLEIKINDDWKSFTVSSILKNPPSNSTLDFNMLVPFQVYLTANNRQSNNSQDWGRLEIGFQTFIVAIPGIVQDSLLSKIEKVRTSKMSGPIATMLGYEIQPLNEVHYDATISNGSGMREASNKLYSILLGGIAFVILMLACINFTNLSVARALPRAKEIGVRKVVGATRKQLVAQFLSEALFVSIIAFVLGLIIAQLVLPVFETVAEKEFSVSIVENPLYIIIAFIVVIIAAFIAGIYPALMISKFNTVSALKGAVGTVGGKNWVQKILVILQFTIAGFLIIGVLTMNRQITYMLNMDKGYDDTNIIGLSLNYDEPEGGGGGRRGGPQPAAVMGPGERMMNLMKNELSQNPNIEFVSGKSTGLRMAMMMTMNEETGESQQVRTFMERADIDFPKTMGMEIIEGRDFNKSNGEAELTNILVNEQFAKKMNWGDSVVGRRFNGSLVVGLVKDYNFQSLENEIDPIIINLDMRQPIGEVYVKFEEGTLTESLATTKMAWEKLNPGKPFDFFLLEERNADQYGDQARWRSMLITASLIAIAISCLGLFGLAYMDAQRRTKEIGVRKVLGAPVPRIVFILSKGFSFLVLISFIIACPLAYYGGEEWLSTFPYHIEMGWDMFVIAGVLTVTVAFLTVGWHAVKTALSNPVKALRYE